MSPFLPPLRLVGADVLTGDAFDARAVGISYGQIVDLPGGAEVDLTGYWLLPGIIDLHGDGFERQMFPRPSAPFPLKVWTCLHRA
jgi:alpha-D-ribose 1-methylphosphonate 5-triphosphate diphosphatase